MVRFPWGPPRRPSLWCSTLAPPTCGCPRSTVPWPTLPAVSLLVAKVCTAISHWGLQSFLSDCTSGGPTTSMSLHETVMITFNVKILNITLFCEKKLTWLKMTNTAKLRHWTKRSLFKLQLFYRCSECGDATVETDCSCSTTSCSSTCIMFLEHCSNTLLDTFVWMTRGRGHLVQYSNIHSSKNINNDDNYDYKNKDEAYFCSLPPSQCFTTSITLPSPVRMWRTELPLPSSMAVAACRATSARTRAR